MNTQPRKIAKLREQFSIYEDQIVKLKKKLDGRNKSKYYRDLIDRDLHSKVKVHA